jgi:hypothetical protein
MSDWIVRKWAGDEWPEKRLSIGDKDSQEALFISPRYADIDSGSVKANFDMAAAAPDMFQALEMASLALDGKSAIGKMIKSALTKARGE